MKPYSPPGASNEQGRLGWTSLVVADILGPPVVWPPDPSEDKKINDMLRRLKPCPKFPRNSQDESYRAWKLGFIKWMFEMRQLSVAENLLWSTFQDALKGGAGGVGEALLLQDPRLMMWGGRPKGGFGPNDPGCLSGIVWYVEDVLDPDHMRRKHEYGKTARESYLRYKTSPSSWLGSTRIHSPGLSSSGALWASRKKKRTE